MEATENSGETQQPLEVGHAEEPVVQVPIVLDAKALAKKKRAERLAEAKAYEQLGLKVLKLKVKHLGEIGSYVKNQLGVKEVGHGTIVAATEKAGEYLERCDAIVQNLLARDPPVDPEVIVAMLGLSRDFTRLLLDTGKEHIAANRQPAAQPSGDTLSIPFPSGSSAMIGVKPPTPPAAQPDQAQLEAPPPPS